MQVPAEIAGDNPKKNLRIGIRTIPPPIPSKPSRIPAKIPPPKMSDSSMRFTGSSMKARTTGLAGGSDRPEVSSTSFS
jgi:hypothetical protein